MKRIFAVAALLGLVGCSTVGHPIDYNKIATFREGVTTPQEVVAALGPPTSRATAGGDIVTLGYSFTEARANPAMFIPIVGLFATGATAHSESVTFVFRNGVLTGSNSGQAQVDSGW